MFGNGTLPTSWPWRKYHENTPRSPSNAWLSQVLAKTGLHMETELTQHTPKVLIKGPFPVLFCAQCYSSIIHAGAGGKRDHAGNKSEQKLSDQNIGSSSRHHILKMDRIKLILLAEGYVLLLKAIFHF